MHWVRFCFSSKVATLCRFWSRDSIDLRSFHPRAQLRQQRREKKSEDPDSSSSVYTMGHLWQQGGILSHFWTVDKLEDPKINGYVALLTVDFMIAKGLTIRTFSLVRTTLWQNTIFG